MINKFALGNNLHFLHRLAIQQFIDDALKAHNEYRLIHGVSPLANDNMLNVGAQKHAEKLARKSINDVAMSNKLGESIYTSCNSVVTGRSVTEAW